MTRRIGIVTLGRSEWAILEPVVKRIEGDGDLESVLFVGGTHLSPDFGMTVSEIVHPIAESVESMLSSHSPQGIGKSMGLTTMAFAQVFANNRPDIFLVTGDRYEMIAAALAAIPFNIPLAHLDGGALTYGAIDEQFRHALTKLSHLHFCYTEENAARVRQMGEESWRVTVTGNPALDGLADFVPLSIKQLAKLGVRVTGDTALVIFHSPTLDYEKVGEYTDNLIRAIDRIRQPAIFVMPNADTGGRVIVKKMRHYAAKHPEWAQCHTNLDPHVFRSLMSHCVMMVGNSSAGIQEAPSFHLPAVNIGDRQAGRLRAGNVIDVGYSTDDILAGMDVAFVLRSTHELDGLVNPYGDGQAADRIATVLKTTPLGSALLVKRWANE